MRTFSPKARAEGGALGRGISRLSIVAAAVLPALLSAPARAQVTGFAANVFEPTPAGDRFFAVPDAASAKDGRLRLGLVGDYVIGPALEGDNGARVISNQFYVHAGAAYPITDFLHAHVDVPFAAVQNGNAQATPSSAFGDIRLGLRANLIDPDVQAFAFGPAADVWLPTGSARNLTSDGRARFNPRLGASGRVGVFAYSANGGFLLRKKIDTTPTPPATATPFGLIEYGNAVTFGAAMGFVFFGDTLQIGGEIWGNHQVSPNYSNSRVTPISVLFGPKLRIGDFVAGVAGGTGLNDPNGNAPGASAPAPGAAPRVVFSLALAPETYAHDEGALSESADRDGDHVLDRVDSCPDEAGAASSDPTKNGCPASAVATELPTSAAADADGDGVPDTEDACPDKLGDRTDDPKTNGCPKPRIADADGDGVRDEIDACPVEKGEATNDPKTNGRPPKNSDTDGDGVPDTADACPRDAGEPSTDPTKNGCPKPVATAATARAPGAGGAPKVTFAGFHVFDDGTSRIYVQLTASVDVEANVVGKKAEYRLVGAVIPIRNNKNPLLTQNFVAEVVSAQLVPEGNAKRKAKGRKPIDTATGVKLVVVMREAALPKHHIVRNADGTATLVVDFPRPLVAPKPESAPAHAPLPVKESDQSE